jgi:alanine-synthesizing transaminase
MVVLPSGLPGRISLTVLPIELRKLLTMFSTRTAWHRQPNRLSETLDAYVQSGRVLHDLTSSNPTDAGIPYPEIEICRALSDPEILSYRPDPKGLLSAREAISRYYISKQLIVDPAEILLTASTSEAYSLIFKLLCNAGERVAIPRPSYPLFEYLAQINDAELAHYDLAYDHGWYIDIESLVRAISPATRAIVVINPHNPTGMFLKKTEYLQVRELARRHRLALIVDEVFIDFPLENDHARLGSTAGEADVLTFTLNGLSKTIGLPQMKLGWITVSGDEPVRREALGRLEILSDTYLSVNTPAQIALPRLLEMCRPVRGEILRRIRTNFTFLKRIVDHSPISVLSSEGGWCGILRIPRTRSEDEWAVALLAETGVYVQPGYFFDFTDEGYLVVSLLTKEVVFERGLNLLKGFVGR